MTHVFTTNHIGIPGGYERAEVARDPNYDLPYRLTAADYSTGEYYHYAYDAVGNKLNETTHLATTNYLYDNANRLTSVNGVPYMRADSTLLTQKSHA